MKHKVQRLGRLSYTKGIFGEIGTPKLSLSHQLLNLGLFVKISTSKAGGWNSAWSVNTEGTSPCTTVVCDTFDAYMYQ